MEKHELSDYSQLKVLIIDDQTLVHQSLGNALADLGVANVKYAENAYYALRLCEQQQFHVVICAFNVKSDKDGFHLLEEMKFKGYVTKRTVLIFLSADTAETVVNSIVELQPDDFWVKPISPGYIQNRLSHILDVKQTLYNLYCAFDHKQFSKVIYYADRHLLDTSLAKYHANLQRMKGEALLALREFSAAQTFFQDLLKQYKYSWVYLGYVKSLLKQHKLAEITDLLKTLQDKLETRFATYDLLAQYYIEQQDYRMAYQEIKKAVKLAPRNIERNKKLWDLARLNQDHEGQYLATQAMAKYARNSIHDSPQLSLNVIRAGIDFASTLPNEHSAKIVKQTEKYLTELEQSPHAVSELREQLIIAKARLYNVRDQRELAERLVDGHVSVRPTACLEDNLDKVKVFHELSQREEALVLLSAVQQQIATDGLTGQVVSRFIEKELETRSEIHFTAKQLNQMAVEHFNRCRYDAAIMALEQALALTPNSARVLISILKVLVASQRKSALDIEHQLLAEQTVKALGAMKLTNKQEETYTALCEELGSY